MSTLKIYYETYVNDVLILNYCFPKLLCVPSNVFNIVSFTDLDHIGVIQEGDIIGKKWEYQYIYLVLFSVVQTSPPLPSILMMTFFSKSRHSLIVKSDNFKVDHSTIKEEMVPIASQADRAKHR